MSTFHDDKIWQEAFTALLDVIEATDSTAGDVQAEVRKQGMFILTEIARGIESRSRISRSLVAPMRSLLSVLWAKECLSDDQFAKLDSAYEALANKLAK